MKHSVTVGALAVGIFIGTLATVYCNSVHALSAAPAKPDPLLKPAKDATAQDITDIRLSAPFPGPFEYIQPQIAELAKCNSAAIMSGSVSKQIGPITIVLNRLQEKVLKVLPSVDAKANLYRFQTEYSNGFWANRAYLVGLAKGLGVDVTQMATEQLNQCLAQYYDESTDKAAADAIATTAANPFKADSWR